MTGVAERATLPPLPTMGDGRTSRSWVRPWSIIPAGTAVCLECPWTLYGLDDPSNAAKQHHQEKAHPTAAVLAEREAELDRFRSRS